MSSTDDHDHCTTQDTLPGLFTIVCSLVYVAILIIFSFVKAYRIQKETREGIVKDLVKNVIADIDGAPTRSQESQIRAIEQEIKNDKKKDDDYVYNIHDEKKKNSESQDLESHDNTSGKNSKTSSNNNVNDRYTFEIYRKIGQEFESKQSDQSETASSIINVNDEQEEKKGVEKNKTLNTMRKMGTMTNLISEDACNKCINRCEWQCCNRHVKDFFTIWWNEIKRLKTCYLVALRHELDQVTDIAVMIEFGKLARQEKTSDKQCEPVNFDWLLRFSVVFFLLYRLISAYSLYDITRKPRRFVYQLFDLELFRTLLVNHAAKSKSACNPQRWIQSLEAIWESTPQALIQLFYIVQISTVGKRPNWIVLVSFGYSILSIANKSTSEDKLAFKRKYQTFSKSKKGYLVRVLFRIIDVTYRTSIIFLIWILFGGFWLITVLLLEASILLIFIFGCKKKDYNDSGLLGCLVWTPVGSAATEKIEQFSKKFRLYRYHSNMVLVVLFWIFLFVQFGCDQNDDQPLKFCKKYEKRNGYFTNSSTRWVIGVLIYCSICAWFFDILTRFIIKNMINHDIKVTNDRNMLKMARISDWQGMSELMLYGAPLPKDLEIYRLILEKGYQDPKLHKLLGFKRLKLLFDELRNAYHFDKENGVVAIEQARLLEKLIFGFFFGYHFSSQVDKMFKDIEQLRLVLGYIVCFKDNPSLCGEYQVFLEKWQRKNEEKNIKNQFLRLNEQLLATFVRQLGGAPISLARKQYLSIFVDIYNYKGRKILNSLKFENTWGLIQTMTPITPLVTAKELKDNCSNEYLQQIEIILKGIQKNQSFFSRNRYNDIILEEIIDENKDENNDEDKEDKEDKEKDTSVSGAPITKSQIKLILGQVGDAIKLFKAEERESARQKSFISAQRSQINELQSQLSQLELQLSVQQIDDKKETEKKEDMDMDMDIDSDPKKQKVSVIKIQTIGEWVKSMNDNSKLLQQFLIGEKGQFDENQTLQNIANRGEEDLLHMFKDDKIGQKIKQGFQAEFFRVLKPYLKENESQQSKAAKQVFVPSATYHE